MAQTACSAAIGRTAPNLSAYPTLQFRQDYESTCTFVYGTWVGATIARALQVATIFNAGMKYGKLGIVKTARKITVEVPADLLERAQRAGGTGITQTVRAGLQLVAASHAYARLRRLRGKVRFSRALDELKHDR